MRRGCMGVDLRIGEVLFFSFPALPVNAWSPSWSPSLSPAGHLGGILGSLVKLPDAGRRDDTLDAATRDAFVKQVVAPADSMARPRHSAARVPNLASFSLPESYWLRAGNFTTLRRVVASCSLTPARWESRTVTLRSGGQASERVG